MFWDNVAGVYDRFENIINKQTNEGICVKVEEEISEMDEVLSTLSGCNGAEIWLIMFLKGEVHYESRKDW